MPTTTTLIEGPNNISAFGTLNGVANQTMDVNGDGRLLESNTHLDPNTIITLTSAGGNNSYGSAFKNCFNDNQIPLGATITGVEIVSDITTFDSNPGIGYDSFFGTSNTNPSTGRILMRCFLFNGEEYSDLLEWNTDSDITFLSPGFYGGNVLALFEGPSKHYGAGSDNQVLFGGSADLSGLNWNPANQADFGYALTVQLSTSTEADFIIRRGIGLRVTYELPFLSSKIIINSGTKVKLQPNITSIITKRGKANSFHETAANISNAQADTMVQNGTGNFSTFTETDDGVQLFVSSSSFPAIAGRFRLMLNDESTGNALLHEDGGNIFNISDIPSDAILQEIQIRIKYQWRGGGSSYDASNRNEITVGIDNGTDHENFTIPLESSQPSFLSTSPPTTEGNIIFSQTDSNFNIDQPQIATLSLEGDTLTTFFPTVESLANLGIIFLYTDDNPSTGKILLYGQNSDESDGAFPEIVLKYAVRTQNKIKISPGS